MGDAEPLSWTGARWAHRHAPPSRIAELEAAGLHPIAARCLAARDLAERAITPDWLTPRLSHLHDPLTMLNMPAALARLERAIAQGERVRIITDYDVDGTTSSLILQACLRLRGLTSVDYHIPDRFDEGYGFSVHAADRAAEDGVDLILTADIGVRDHAAVQRAMERGVDVLVCDHHLPAGATVPADAIVLCPPQAGCDYENPSLAACGVSLKLAQALLREHPKVTQILRSLLKLAAIGTVADMVPLSTLENRAIVSLGLRELNLGPHAPGLAALIDVAGLQLGQITERDLGFRIGPRINAAGRVASASLVVQLLTSRDPIQARAHARQLDELNGQRRQLQLRMVQRALDAVPDPPPGFVLIAQPEGEEWHRGVAGIVASRLKDDLQRPAAVVAIFGDRAVGSVRSVPAIHAVHALDSVSDLLEKHGGHPAAAGFTVPTEHLSALAERLAAFVDASVDASALVPEHRVDVALPSDHLSTTLHAQLASLGPFGMGNPEPRLHLQGVRAERVSVRASGRLLHLALRGAERQPVEAIWWGEAERRAQFEGPVDLLGTLGEHTWKGRTTLQFRITDARAAT